MRSRTLVTVALLGLLIGGVAAVRPRAQNPPADGCATTVLPGQDIAAAIAAASPGATVCLGRGEHRPFALDRSAPANVVLQSAAGGRAVIVAEAGDGIVLLGTRGLTLAELDIRGGAPAGIYAAATADLRLRAITLDGSAIGVHIDDGASATLDEVTIRRASDLGLLVRRGAAVDGTAVRVIESGGAGIAAVAGAGPLSLREALVERAAGPGIFVGSPGCGNLGAATLEVPDCFYADLDAYLSDTIVRLEGVTVRDGPGTGIVLFPGVRAEIRRSTVSRQELTGIFAWGASVEISESLFTQNAEHAVEYRAYPDPRREVRRLAIGSIRASQVRGTRPFGGPVLGGGILVQGGDVTVAGNDVRENAGIGIAYVNGATGAIRDNGIYNNGGSALCLATTGMPAVAGNRVSGNRADEIGVCDEPFPPR